MQEENQVVTAPVDTQDNSTTDRIEVETNIPAPEVEDNVEAKVEPSEAPQQQKPVNPRTEKRKAEKERLIRENAAKDEQLKQLRAELEKGKPPVNQTEEKKGDRPKLEDFEDVIEWVKADNEWAATNLSKKAIQDYESEKSTKLKEETKIRNTQELVTQLAEISKEEPDIMEKITALDNTGLITEDIGDALMSSDIKGKLWQHLSKFPGDLIQLRGIPKQNLPAAIKQIEAFINGNNVQERPRVTQAKPPILPPGNTAKTDRSVNSYTQEEIENMPLSEYRSKFMNK